MALGFIEILQSWGFFTFLAHLLVFIVLYCAFKYAFEKHVKRLKSADKIKAISLVLSILITILFYLFLASFASTAASYIAAAVFILLFLFIIMAVASRLVGIDMVELLRK